MALRPDDHRHAWLEIDLAAIRGNVAAIRGLVGPGVRIAPVVKADAYGHGLAEVALDLAGVADALCVATLDEALALREAGLEVPLFLLYPIPPDGLVDALRADLELTLMSEVDLRNVQRAIAAGRGGGPRRWPGPGSGPGGTAAPGPVLVHLAVETGLGRGGFPVADVAGAATEVMTDDDLVLAGLWSHLASGGDPDVTARQVRRFADAAGALTAAGIEVPARHLAATDGLFAGGAAAYEMVRPGLATYGVLDDALPIAGDAGAAAAALRPAMALKARPVTFVDVAVGESVGYGGRWHAERPSRMAILPIGYGDGYARGEQPGAEVLVRGGRRPVAGVISMDSLAVDVTDLPSVGYDEEFVLLGSQAHQRIGAGELARWRNTIAWEVLSGMSPRLTRVYNLAAG